MSHLRGWVGFAREFSFEAIFFFLNFREALKQTETEPILLFPPLGSNLTEVGQNQFGRLGSLEQLLLQANSIHLLQPGAFHGLHSLTHLSLAANQIATIQAGVFSGIYSGLSYTILSSYSGSLL